VSANIHDLLAVEPGDMLGHALREFVTDDVVQALAETVNFGDAGAVSQRAASANIGHMAQLCDLSVHYADGLVHIEIEPQPQGAAERSPTVVAQSMITRIAGSDDDTDFFQGVADQVRRLTGYHRVMVYRFRHDEAGEVVAEARDSEVESFLGLRFPASDIPPQARALYVSNRVRVIPDAHYVPVPIVPDRTAEGGPLDLSQHMLRSVSPVHVEYLHNMGVAASMSISIVVAGRLWGLVACHHLAPRPVPPGVRAACDLFGLFVSMRVAAREQQASTRAEEAARQVRDTLALRLDRAHDPRHALLSELPLLMRAVPSDGVGLWHEGHWHTGGRAPGAAAVPGLLAWAADVGGTMPATNRAGDWTTPELADGLAGVLAFELAPGSDEWVVFFRREEVREVRWAGAPDEPFTIDGDGRRIGPRKSFASWRETVRGRGAPWREYDLRQADRLRLMLRERHRRDHARFASVISDLAGQRVRADVRNQRERLAKLAGLFDGLVNLGDGEAGRLAHHIDVLEAEINALMHLPEAASD
jgi:light-regulated signal transduction histidine kinase (bacteriophytochrome)